MTDTLTLANLPSVSDARLPATYEAASRALGECSKIDECMTWANKAQAMASYARQSKDDTLRKMADRIQARAIRRCGELLRAIPAVNGARGVGKKWEGDAPPPLTRTQAATDAGMSADQRKTALRVASIPEPAFTRQVESDQPPTVTALAAQGTKAKPLVDLGAIPPKDYARATEAMGALRHFAQYCEAQDPVRIAAAFMPHEIPAIRKNVAVVDGWLDRFVANLPE